MEPVIVPDDCQVLSDMKRALALGKRDELYRDINKPGFDPDYQRVLLAILSKAERDMQRPDEIEIDALDNAALFEGDDESDGDSQKGGPKKNDVTKTEQMQKDKAHDQRKSRKMVKGKNVDGGDHHEANKKATGEKSARLVKKGEGQSLKKLKKVVIVEDVVKEEKESSVEIIASRTAHTAKKQFQNAEAVESSRSRKKNIYEKNQKKEGDDGVASDVETLKSAALLKGNVSMENSKGTCIKGCADVPSGSG